MLTPIVIFYAQWTLAVETPSAVQFAAGYYAAISCKKGAVLCGCVDLERTHANLEIWQMKITHSRITAIVALILASSISPAFSAQINPEKDAAKEDSRYVIKGGEVYDKKMDLTWQRCSVGRHWKKSGGCAGTIKIFTFNEAQRQGSGGWRIPSKAELRSLLVHKQQGNQKSMIDETAFPDMDESKLLYWTNMPMDADGWYIRVSDGYISYGAYRQFKAAVRLVRSGQ